MEEPGKRPRELGERKKSTTCGGPEKMTDRNQDKKVNLEKEVPGKELKKKRQRRLFLKVLDQKIREKKPTLGPQ